jgi:hypothetical protein
VYAVDVGYGQLALQLRQDPRVRGVCVCVLVCAGVCWCVLVCVCVSYGGVGGCQGCWVSLEYVDVYVYGDAYEYGQQGLGFRV